MAIPDSSPRAFAGVSVRIPQMLMSYGPPWAHYLGGYQDRLLGGPMGLLSLCHTTLDGMGRKDYDGEVLG
jgi:hypothetical protein